MATRPGNGLFGTGHNVHCLFERKPNNLTFKASASPLHGLCCLQRWAFCLGWWLHTNPLCKSSFLIEIHYSKSFGLVLPTRLLPKSELLTPVHLRCSFICFKALSVCARLYAHACTALCTHANNAPTLLQPKLCCPFNLQVMTKINCEPHSACTEFTVQMNSNEEYIEIQ